MRGVKSWGVIFTPSEKPAPHGERLPGHPHLAVGGTKGLGEVHRASAVGEGGARAKVVAAVCSHLHTDARLGSPGSCTPPQDLAISPPRPWQAEPRLLCSRPPKSGRLHPTTQQVTRVSFNSHSIHHAILGAGGWAWAKVGKRFYFQTRADFAKQKFTPENNSSPGVSHLKKLRGK